MDRLFFDYYYHYDDGDNSDGDESWDATPVTFIRPDGSAETKDIQWCLDNNFFEVEERYWSGDWYYEFHPEEKPLHEQRMQRMKEIRQENKERRNRIMRQRNCPIRAAIERHQDAAFTNVLIGEIASLQGIPEAEVGPFVDGLLATNMSTAGISGRNANARNASANTNTNTVAGTGLYGYGCASPYHNTSSPYSPNLRADGSNHLFSTPSAHAFEGQQAPPKKKKKKKRKKKKTHSSSSEKVRQQENLENDVVRAEGDQDLVDRTREAFQESNTFPDKCPIKTKEDNPNPETSIEDQKETSIEDQNMTVGELLDVSASGPAGIRTKTSENYSSEGAPAVGFAPSCTDSEGTGPSYEAPGINESKLAYNVTHLIWTQKATETPPGNHKRSHQQHRNTTMESTKTPRQKLRNGPRPCHLAQDTNLTRPHTNLTHVRRRDQITQNQMAQLRNNLVELVLELAALETSKKLLGAREILRSSLKQWHKLTPMQPYTTMLT